MTLDAMIRKPLVGTLLLALLMLAGMPVTAEETDKTLTLLNWSEYLAPEVVAEFERRYGVRLKQVYFESDDLRNQMLLDSGAVGFDLVMVNGTAISTYSHLGWLEPLAKDQIVNLKHIDPRWLAPFPRAERYAVPYFWGTEGIAYRSDKIPAPVESWNDLLKPSAALSQRILMNEDSAELIGAALKALGYSLNSTDSEELKQAEALLMAQKPFVSAYSTLALGEDSGLVTGKIWMAMAYSGDVLMAQEHNAAIRYVLPREGGAIWVDYLTILASSTNKALAHQFINFLNEPEINARNAQFVYYATPNQAAEKLLPEEFKSNPVIYPSAQRLNNSEFFKVLPPRVKRKRNAIFSRVVN